MTDLTRTLTEVSERGTPIGSARLRERVMLDLAADASVPARRRFNVARPAWAFLAAAGLMLVLLGVVPLVVRAFNNGESEAPTATVAPATVTTVIPETTLPATTPPATPAPAEFSTPTTLPPKPASLDISWQRVPEQASLEDGWIAAVTPGGPGYVAVGGTVGCAADAASSQNLFLGPRQNCPRDAAVWVSPDGVTWERIESPSFRGDSVREDSVPLDANADSPDGIQYMNDVAVGPEGLVAVGAAPVVDDLDRPGIWVSPDGRQWELLPHDEDLFSGVEEMVRIVTFGDRLVAVAGLKAWVSSDSRNWENVDIDRFSTGAVLDLTVWNGTLVAVGERDGHPAVWTSDDGFSWTTVEDTDLMTAGGRLQGVGGDEAGLVALGTKSMGRVTPWRSENGIDWTAVPEYYGINLVDWDSQARTAVSVSRGTGGIENDLILINGSATLWGTADGGELWYAAGEFDGGSFEVLAGPSPAVFNTVNQVLVADDQLLAFGKVVAWSETEPIGGLCYIDAGDGSRGSCRADATIWVGTWDGAP
jgi:hypothetical protein